MHTGEGNGTPLQYSCLENPMDGGACWAAVHGVAGSWTWLSDFTFTFHFHALKKEMATHFSVLAWRIPGMGEPCGLPSTGSHRVRHDWSDLAAAAGHMWLFTPLVSFSLSLFFIYFLLEDNCFTEFCCYYVAFVYNIRSALSLILWKMYITLLATDPQVDHVLSIVL